MLFSSIAGWLTSSLILLVAVEAQTPVQILGASPRQSIDGFGCSLAFMGAAIQNLPATPRSAILNYIFSPTTGAGCSILRLRISPYLTTSSGDVDIDSDSEEVGSRYVLFQAKALGVTRYVAVAWTPPPAFKTNNASDGGTVDTSAASLGGYATYLSKYLRAYYAKYAVKWYAVSPQNEPDVEDNYETCRWEADDYANFLATYLQPRFQQDGVRTPIMAAEYGSWFEDFLAPTFNNPTARAAVQLVSAHPYHGGWQNGTLDTSGYDQFPLSKKYNKTLWATEYNNKTSSDTIVDSLRIATLMHKHMTVPESNAFFAWWGATNIAETAKEIGESLIPFQASGSYVVHKRLWAFGQFARFIRPGWTRIDATAEPLKGVHISAYKNGNSQIAIVAINENTAAADVRFNLYNLQLSSLTGYRTSSTESIKSIGSFTMYEGTTTASLLAQSITTFIGTTNTSAPAFPGTPAFITEFNSLAGSSGASGGLTDKFSIGTVDPSGSGSDETSLIRQANTAEYVQYPIASTGFKSFYLTVQLNTAPDRLTFAAVSSSGALTTLKASPVNVKQQATYWSSYSYNITVLPPGTKHVRINFSPTNAEWNPRLTRLVISYA